MEGIVSGYTTLFAKQAGGESSLAGSTPAPSACLTVPRLNKPRPRGGMADTLGLEPSARKGVRVQVSPRPLIF